MADSYTAELSTPFTNGRWMLKEAGGGTATTVYLLNGVLVRERARLINLIPRKSCCDSVVFRYLAQIFNPMEWKKSPHTCK
jgi:hypothetical protein